MLHQDTLKMQKSIDFEFMEVALQCNGCPLMYVHVDTCTGTIFEKLCMLNLLSLYIPICIVANDRG